MDEGQVFKGHQELVDLVGRPVLTLKELWPEPEVMRAMVVGINPAETSVKAGHYYRGRSGRRAMERLRDAGLIQAPTPGEQQDDAALRSGVGFADLVRRPTAKASQLSKDELAAGRERLLGVFSERRIPLVVCVFKPPADALVQGKSAVGFQLSADDRTLLFRMPPPFARKELVVAEMTKLQRYVETGEWN